MSRNVSPTGVRIPAEVRDEAKKVCARIDRSMNWYIVKAVRELNQRMKEGADEGNRVA